MAESTSGSRSRTALLVRLSAVGDVVHALPVAAALADAGWRVAWLVEPGPAPLLAGNPAVAEVIVGPTARRFAVGPARRAAESLRALRPDVVVDVQGLWKSAVWARLAGAERTIGFAARARREGASAILAREWVTPPRRAVHVVDRNLALLAPLGLDVVGRHVFPLPPLADADATIAARLAEVGIANGAAFVLCQPGGGWASKLWPVERWGEFARDLGERGVVPLVAWGPGEKELAEAVATASGGVARVGFPTTLVELAALARRASAVVGADTGPIHLAAAAGAPVVALFGPTDPARNGPLGPAVRVLRAVPPCAPCHRRNCPRHDGVVGEITAAEVLAALGELGVL